ncbi:matrix metalloproteinase-16-like protein [Dinothrombium tinctorium]|uniref:Matrix metalloproteinase-16-like protein n=1 Tax=Dinothrombium tinctorium TaxID=1965070 RepID=A0A3S3RIZ2_9ACAR|nr:matrix metalloproteinase-16-like protein [Dinothrombium tinctorium]
MPTAPKEPEKQNDRICSSMKFDAATTINGVTYLFRGEYYFTIDAYQKVNRKGRKISDDFNDLPSTRVKRGPFLIGSHFKNVPNDLDAAFVYSKDGLIYFVKNGKYIQYQSEGKQLTDEERLRNGFNFNADELNKMTVALTFKANNVFFFDYYYGIVGKKGWVQKFDTIEHFANMCSERNEDINVSETSDTLTTETTSSKRSDIITSTRTQLLPKESEKSDEDICSSTEFDAATTINGVTFLFRGDYYFTMDSYGEIQRKGRKISDDFNGLPSNLDAAVTTRDGTTYFFKGDQYYQAQGRKVESGPKPISSYFKNVPNNLEAAFVYSKDNLIYFIKNNKFIRYELEGKKLTQQESHHNGFNFYPIDVKAVFTSNKNHFFFYQEYYYRVGEQGWVQEQAKTMKEFLSCNN